MAVRLGDPLLAMTRRGKALSGVVAVVGVVALAVIVSKFGGETRPTDPAAPTMSIGADGSPVPVVETCPLTGAPPPNGKVPDRPALAIKVENAIEARPQYGLDMADIIYEQPVEGGITRFIVIYQCQDAHRVEPVRSARTSDPPILLQYGSPLFAYADAAGYVEKAVAKYKQINDVNWHNVDSAYHEDGSRVPPHHLYTSTKELFDQAKRTQDAPQPVFTYGEIPPEIPTKPGRKVHLEFSSTYADVWWKYQDGVYKRFHGSEPHLLAGQDQVQADNVLVQVVKIDYTGHKDAANNPVPEVVSVGTGKAYLLRDGKMIVGKWGRANVNQRILFATKAGKEFVLKPGTTWVELYPSSAAKVKG